MYDLNKEILDLYGYIPEIFLSNTMTGFHGSILELLVIRCKYPDHNYDLDGGLKNHQFIAFPNQINDDELEDLKRGLRDRRINDNTKFVGISFHVTKPLVANFHINDKKNINFDFPVNRLGTAAVTPESWALAAWYFNFVYPDEFDTNEIKKSHWGSEPEDRAKSFMNRICRYYGPASRNLYTFEFEKNFEIKKDFTVDTNDLIINANYDDIVALANTIFSGEDINYNGLKDIHSEMVALRKEVLKWNLFDTYVEVFAKLMETENVIDNPKINYYYELMKENNIITTNSLRCK
jgi:hypothetical protein